MLLNEVNGSVQRLEHAQSEQVKLHEPSGGAVILVPLQYRSTRSPTPLHGTDLADGAIADHHAGRVDTEVTRPIEKFCCHLFNVRPITRSFFGCHLVNGGVAKGPRHVTLGRAWSIGNDIGHLRGVVTAVAAIDVLNHFFSSTRLDINVNIWRPVSGCREEAFEKEVEPHRVGVGNAECKTGGRVSGRATALAVDVLPAAELRDVPHNQEVAGKAQLLDNGEFMINLTPGPDDALGRSGSVPPRRPFTDELFEVTLLIVAGGRWKVWQLRCNQSKIKGQLFGNLTGPIDHTGPTSEAAALFIITAQTGHRRRRQPALHLAK
ncbi:unannotated protein [freshwater metagenome]|uniref:Unannotated protein n=1 Tax=freshwater metagenome TaxID=449393 RepID=A0A6J6X2S5_9ZZZZ